MREKDQVRGGVEMSYRAPSSETIKEFNTIKQRFVLAGFPHATEGLTLSDPSKPTDKFGLWYLDGESIKTLSVLVDKILKNRFASEALEKDPFIIGALVHYQSEGILNFDNVKLKNYLKNVEIRLHELKKNREDLGLRLDRSPVATEDELLIGAFKEQLESQVRDAAIILTRKGYKTYGSGFYHPLYGEQYMNFRDEISEKFSVKFLNEDLVNYEVTAAVKKMGDSWELILRPDKEVPLDKWKEIWDEVAMVMPKIGEPEENNHSGQYLQNFRLAQDKIKNKEDVYLGIGRAYIDGRVEKISPADFKKRAEQKKSALHK